MHTTTIGTTTFIHNGGYDGRVTIVTADERRIDVEFEDLKGFIAEYVRSTFIAAVEQATHDELLRE